MGRPAYPTEYREAALRLAAEIGLKPAARKLGISRTTLYRWAHPGYTQRERAMNNARKERYRRPCESCGELGSWAGQSSNGGTVLCARCILETSQSAAEECAALYELGLSTYDIEARTGIRHQQVWWLLKRHGTATLRGKTEAARLAVSQGKKRRPDRRLSVARPEGDGE